jgi:uncharacterized protein YkwD
VLSTNVAIVLIALVSSAHADEQNLTVQTDTAPIENSPLPRPKPSLLDATEETSAVLISAFRHQHGEDSVVISAALTRIAQDQANAMAIRDSLDHNALAPFSSRIGRSGLSRAAENTLRGTCLLSENYHSPVNGAFGLRPRETTQTTKRLKIIL